MPLALAITPGELAGIGPDILIQHIQTGSPHELVCFADPGALLARAKQLNLRLRLRDPNGQPLQTGELAIVPSTAPGAVSPGTPNPDQAHYLLSSLDAAITACQNGECAAMVTGPLQKSVINDAGIPFTGHTEYLAAKTDTPQVVMMLASRQLRVALATTHLPLADVSAALTGDKLRAVINILVTDLHSKFGIARPTVYVAGLNPHAGEGGHMGREEIDIIAPVLDSLRDTANLVGPLPADTMFSRENLASADAFLAMYHDQGLPVIKALSFGEAANITLGLPIIRTSVDHGTALTLAGTGRANSSGFAMAVEAAAELSTRQRSVQRQ